jgi:hypothetical protein
MLRKLVIAAVHYCKPISSSSAVINITLSVLSLWLPNVPLRLYSHQQNTRPSRFKSLNSMIPVAIYIMAPSGQKNPYTKTGILSRSQKHKMIPFYFFPGVMPFLLSNYIID